MNEGKERGKETKREKRMGIGKLGKEKGRNLERETTRKPYLEFIH